MSASDKIRHNDGLGVPAKIIGDVRKLDYDIFKNESWNNNIHPYLENQGIH